MATMREKLDPRVTALSTEVTTIKRTGKNGWNNFRKTALDLFSAVSQAKDAGYSDEDVRWLLDVCLHTVNSNRDEGRKEETKKEVTREEKGTKKRGGAL